MFGFVATLLSTMVLRVQAPELPAGSSPQPVASPHFPDRLHAFIWRNWPLIPAERLAKVVGAKTEDIVRMGKAMGLPDQPNITKDREQRSYLTVIRRNWHLLPYDQLLKLLGWTPEQMAYTLREDDFLYIKLGSLKPKCEPIRYEAPDAAAQEREAEIAKIVRFEFPDGLQEGRDPLFGFVKYLSQPTVVKPNNKPAASRFSPRYCYSYFALYGDPLLNDSVDPYPDGYLSRMAASGVDGVWLQGVLYKLAPYPWQPGLSDRYQERLANLKKLTVRAKKYGIRVYLYLNEPRAMPLAFFKERPQVKGVVEGDYAAMCTSNPEVRDYIRSSTESICKAVPDLGGFFTITASENLTNCWSHHRGAECERCKPRGPEQVIAEVNSTIQEGIDRSKTHAKLLAWDWGWQDESAPGIIARLPKSTWLMSVSEWSLPIERGGVKNSVGEYSISSVGPGPRATKHWKLAQDRGLNTAAKVQAGNTWEISTVPYIPALENVARHALNLRGTGVNGIMLGWTLGGYPSPNLEVMSEIGKQSKQSDSQDTEAAIQSVLLRVAEKRVAKSMAPALVNLWRRCSAAFREYPYDGSLVYNAPIQLGPANPLWGKSTGYRATMVGFPYDDIDSWRGPYPPKVYISQFQKMADGFDAAIKAMSKDMPHEVISTEVATLHREISVAEACAIHFRSAANQARYVVARKSLESITKTEDARTLLAEIEIVLKSELSLAKRLFALQQNDSRLGFEASNQYAFVPQDLAEKVLNCHDLLDRWLPEQRAKWVTR